MRYTYRVELNGAPYGEREFDKHMEVGDSFPLSVNKNCGMSRKDRVQVIAIKSGSVAVPSTLVVKKV